MAARIYTRTGDSGETGLFGGQRVGKDDLRVEAYGGVDELNAVLGAAAAAAPEALRSELLALQSELFTVGADLATPAAESGTHGRVTIPRVTPAMVARLEQRIDAHETALPALTQFILPGGGMSAALLHQARAVCRRAERACVALHRADPLEAATLAYLNRLSDLLFVLARRANALEGRADVPWVSPTTEAP